MLIQQIEQLYEALDYRVESERKGNVRLFHRVEGADHAWEIVWALDSPGEGSDYGSFSYLIQETLSKPGNRRQRIVASKESFLELPPNLRVSAEVGKYSWIGLVNDLFHSERFCDKVAQDYTHYASLLTQQITAISGATEATYKYVDQKVSDLGWATKGFFENCIIRPGTAPRLYVVQAPAGYGKTAFAYELAFQVAKRHKEAPELPFPIFIPFAKYRRFGGVRDILRAEIEELKLYGVNSRALLQVIHDGHAVVLLDGFDELIAEVGAKSAKANLAAISEFLQGSARVILTSRSAFLSTSAEIVEMMENRIGVQQVQVVNLVPFERDQQRGYLLNLGLDRQSVDKAIGILAMHPNLPTLCKSPLLLNTVASLARQGYNGELSIDLLYETHIQVLCERERERQQHNLSNELQAQFARRISLSMYADNTYHYEPDLLGLFWDTEGQELLLTAGYLPTDLESLRTKLMCHALFDSALSADPLRERRGIQFIHPSFRDFFVASGFQQAAMPGADSTKAIDLLRRPIPEGLLEIVCWRKDMLQGFLELFLKQKDTGLRNVLSLLSVGIETGSLSPRVAESALEGALRKKKLEHTDLSGLRFYGVRLTGWTFTDCNLNDTQWRGCAFCNCDFRGCSLFGCTVFDCDLVGSNFGRADTINGLGVVVDNQLERLYDNREIRMWLHSRGATVETQDLPLLQERVPEEVSLGRELVLHVFEKFYPRGSENEQRHRLVSAFSRSLPPHRKGELERVLEWLKRRGVIEPGPLLQRNETLALATSYRGDVRSFMRQNVASSRISSLLTEADPLFR